MLLSEKIDYLEKEMLKDLEYIVNLDTATANKTGVDRLGGWFKGKLRAMDWQINEIKQERTGNTIIARKEGKIPGQIGIFAHLDTAHPQDITREWTFQRAGSRVSGPGVADMKGGLITGLYALQNLNWSNCKSIEFIINGDEEIGSPDSNQYLRQVASRSDLILTLEPARPNGAMVTSRRGTAAFNLKVQGISAHSLNEPEKGRSAILELAYKVIELEKLGDRSRKVNINVGIIEGGGGSGTAVPAQASCKFFISFKQEKDYQECLQQVKEICQQKTVADTSCHLDGGIVFPAMKKVKGSQEIIRIVKGTASNMGMQIKEATGGSSDAGFAAAEGTPVLCGLGPIGGNLHTRDEYLEISSLVRRTAFFINILTSISSKIHTKR